MEAQAPGWLKALQDYWWLATILVTIAGALFKLGYNTRKLEQRYKDNDAQHAALIATQTSLTSSITVLDDRTHRLEQGMEKQAEQLAAVNRNINSLRRQDNMSMRTTFAILDGLKQLKCNGAVSAAHDELRKHLLPIEGEEEDLG